MKNLRLLSALLGVLCVSALNAPAQVSVFSTPAVYPLTNSTTFTLASGGTNFNGTTVAINSQPFPITRGKGFAFAASLVATDATSAAVTYTFQFSTPKKNYAGTLVTNWSTVGTLPLVFPLNGTTRQFAITNVPAVFVDNFAIGRLFTVLNAHTNYVSIDPTNTFISVAP